MPLKIFDYCCDNHHVFEVWQRDENQPPPEACPVCGSAAVSRRPSAPALKPVAGTTRTEVDGDVRRRRATEAAAAARERLRAVIRATPDVGEAFPKTVRDMKRGKIEEAPVRGRCTPLEASKLAAEGIEVAAFPDELLEPLN